MNEIKEFKSKSFYITTEEHSWSLFSITEKGDLTITGDWGGYGYSWRSFGDDFIEFLQGINAEYLISKLASNLNYMIPNGGTKVFGKNQDNRKAEAIKFLFLELKIELKDKSF